TILLAQVISTATSQYSTWCALASPPKRQQRSHAPSAAPHVLAFPAPGQRTRARPRVGTARPAPGAWAPPRSALASAWTAGSRARRSAWPRRPGHGPGARGEAASRGAVTGTSFSMKTLIATYSGVLRGERPAQVDRNRSPKGGPVLSREGSRLWGEDC
ncbi:hypothetical protein J0S82_010066, partial [Galemys pyrenaicus]